MTVSEKTLQAIYSALDELNRQRPSDRRLPRDKKTALTGASGALDSLELVTFVVAVEQRIEDAFGESVTLTDADLWARENGPFTTVGTLATYIEGALGGGVR